MKKAAILPKFITAIIDNQMHYEIEQSVEKSINSSSDENEKVLERKNNGRINTVIQSIVNH